MARILWVVLFWSMFGSLVLKAEFIDHQTQLSSGQWVNGVWKGPDGQFYDRPSTYTRMQRGGVNESNNGFAGQLRQGTGGWEPSGLWRGPNGRYYDHPRTFLMEQRRRLGSFDSMQDSISQRGHWIANDLWQGPDNRYYDSPATYDRYVGENRNGESPESRLLPPVPDSPQVQSVPHPDPRPTHKNTEQGEPKVDTSRPRVSLSDNRVTRFPVDLNHKIPEEMFALVTRRPDLHQRNDKGEVLSQPDPDNGGIQKRFEIMVYTEEASGGRPRTGGMSGATLIMRVPLSNGKEPKRNMRGEPLCEHGLAFTAHSLPYDENGYPNPAAIEITNSSIKDFRGRTKAVAALATKSLRIDVKPGHETHSQWGLADDPLKGKGLHEMTRDQVNHYFASKIQRGSSDAAIAYFELPCDFYPPEAVTEMVPKGWRQPGGTATVVGIGGREVEGTLSESKAGAFQVLEYKSGQIGIEGGASGGPILNEEGQYVGPLVAANGQRENGVSVELDHRAPDFFAQSMIRHLRAKGVEVPSDFRGGDLAL